MAKLPIGLQVYSVREQAQEDFIQTMEEIKRIGYDGVELAGLYGHTPQQIHDWLHEIGLEPISAHVPYVELKDNMEKTVADYAVVGCTYLAIPHLGEGERYGTKAYQEMLEKIPSIAKECRKYDMTLLYHNHDFEFQRALNGEYVLDTLYQQIEPKDLQTEIDTCWVKAAGEDPAAYVRKYQGRCPVVHLKDFTGKKPVEFRAVGYGIQNMQEILTASIESGAQWVIVEQDGHTEHSPIEDARLSIEYLKTLNWDHNNCQGESEYEGN